ncbi:MAG: LTA synthase family protein, partial [Ruthenibacterium sp.]
RVPAAPDSLAARVPAAPDSLAARVPAAPERLAARARVPLAAFLCGMLLWNEAVLRLATASRFFGIGLLYAALFAVPAAALLWLLCTCFGARGCGRCVSICGAVLYVLFASQMIYHTVFSTFYTVFSAAGGGAQVTEEFLPVIVSTIARRAGFLLLLALPLIAMGALRAARRLSLGRATAKSRVRTACFALTAQIVAICALPLAGMAQNSPFALYFQTRVLTQSMDKLGLVTTMRHDVTDLLFGFEESATVGVDTGAMTVKSYAADGNSGAEEAAGAAADAAAPVTGNAAYERRPQTLAIDFAQLADSEPNAAIAQIHRTVASLPPTDTNEKTGLFAGKNLIYIVAESFSPYAIDKTRTPTLYQMQHDGWFFPHFYTGVWGVSTLDGEYVADVGLVPKQGVWSMLLSGQNALPFTLGNEFRARGASTYAYHNGTYDYYSRHLSHPNLGYAYKGVNGGLTMTNEWPRSDAEMIDITTSDYLSDAMFHVYYLTISGHLPYDGSDMQAKKHAAAVAGLPYSQHVKNYLAAHIELDKAMELLLQRLRQAGRLDDTVIVISPDHYPYGLTNDEISELAGHPVETEFELYKSCFILYNADTKGETVQKYCSSLDLLPTMLNLFDLPFDSRLLAGRDIFSDAPAFVPFVTQSFLTDRFRYNAPRNEATPLTAQPVTPEEIAACSERLTQMFALSRKMLETDYYRSLPAAALPGGAR